MLCPRVVSSHPHSPWASGHIQADKVARGVTPTKRSLRVTARATYITMARARATPRVERLIFDLALGVEKRGLVIGLECAE